MFRKITDFTEAFTYESQTTSKLFKNISNDVMLLKPNDNIRSIQRVIWHITITLGEMLGKAGLQIDCPDEHSNPPDDMDTVYNTYNNAAASVLKEVGNWKDEQLNDKVEMYGEEWRKGIVLMVLIKHEAHHRGQLTTLMRLNGLTVTGAYGPSKEEWLAWNMQSPD